MQVRRPRHPSAAPAGMIKLLPTRASVSKMAPFGALEPPEFPTVERLPKEVDHLLGTDAIS